jgi:hypothetical protein
MASSRRTPRSAYWIFDLSTLEVDASRSAMCEYNEFDVHDEPQTNVIDDGVVRHSGMARLRQRMRGGE